MLFMLRKCAAASIMLCGLLGLIGASAALLDAQSTGPVAAFGMNEGSGTTTADSSGSGITGSLQGATWTSSGKYGSALSFNGTSSYVDLGNPTVLQATGSMTWSAWIFATGNPPDDGQIISRSTDTRGWQLKTTPDTGRRTFGVAVSGTGSTQTQRYSNTAVALNTWYYVAGVYNSSTRTLDIYVNGALDNGVPGRNRAECANHCQCECEYRSPLWRILLPRDDR